MFIFVADIISRTIANDDGLNSKRSRTTLKLAFQFPLYFSCLQSKIMGEERINGRETDRTRMTDLTKTTKLASASTDQNTRRRNSITAPSASSLSPQSLTLDSPQLLLPNSHSPTLQRSSGEIRDASWSSSSLHLIPLALAEMRRSAHEIIEQIWRLQHHTDLPGWRRDNDYLVANYRPSLASVTECAASIFKFHSETFNIWTHLLGLIFLILCIFYGYCGAFVHDGSGRLLPDHEVEILNLHLLMSALCFLFSATFHMLECHSPFIHDIFCRLDHLGIAGVIWACELAWIRCSSLDRDERINIALIRGAHIVSLTSVILQFSGFLSRPSHRTFRTIWFISSSTVFVIFPLVDVVQNHGLKIAREVARADLFLLSILFILAGCMFYVFHVPERFFPGRCDIFLQGHTLLHIFVIFTIFTQVYGFRESAINRENWRLAQKSSFSIMGMIRLGH